jgi:hypothetical protein
MLKCINRSWIQGNVNQFCPKCKAQIKIEEEKPKPIPEFNSQSPPLKVRNLETEYENVSINKYVSEIEYLKTIQDINGESAQIRYT